MKKAPEGAFFIDVMVELIAITFEINVFIYKEFFKNRRHPVTSKVTSDRHR
jgi:hypothetical protein